MSLREVYPWILRKLFGLSLPPSRARRESNLWLRRHAAEVTGKVLSIGSGTDEDGEGGKYRDYFKTSTSYTTSDSCGDFHCDVALDVQSIPEIQGETFDCIFCSGVLEHVGDYLSALREMTRVLKKNGILLLGVPFRQPIHRAPNDYWRFTEDGVRYLLRMDYDILELAPIDPSVDHFPAAYWVKAKKR